jgi:hypothetical protein
MDFFITDTFFDPLSQPFLGQFGQVITVMSSARQTDRFPRKNTGRSFGFRQSGMFHLV